MVSAGPVSQTIRNKGGTFRRARNRSRQVAGSSPDLGSGGWNGIKYQCSAEERLRDRNGALGAPFDTPSA